MGRHLAVYTGSFDPITLGHLDVLARTRGMFDEVILAIGHNPNKPALFSFEERLGLARACVEDLVRASPAGAAVRVET
ncbi:MAG: adenylyltransferase/cytidyltransferase family protein [Phycisphaerales bacterium]